MGLPERKMLTLLEEIEDLGTNDIVITLSDGKFTICIDITIDGRRHVIEQRLDDHMLFGLRSDEVLCWMLDCQLATLRDLLGHEEKNILDSLPQNKGGIPSPIPYDGATPASSLDELQATSDQVQIDDMIANYDNLNDEQKIVVWEHMYDRNHVRSELKQKGVKP